MKLGFFGNDYKLGVVKGDNIVDVSSVAKEYGTKPQDQIAGVIENWSTAKGKLESAAASGAGVPISSVKIQAPNPKKKHGGRRYQARCLEVLSWLHAEGDITSLVLSPKVE